MSNVKTQYSTLLALAALCRTVATLASAAEAFRLHGMHVEHSPAADALAALAVLSEVVDIAELCVLGTHFSVAAASLEAESAVVQRLRRKLDTVKERYRGGAPAAGDVSRETTEGGV